ncbi:protein ACCELERATED CELL DEATH 6-like [Chenopodium quinoa]|uniref:protein ACCELERATED CELL DEATH 6-like n=1 Tax=Chenopodium quinoa TaxID=63459 RepID=UPI000B78D03C|nr:protein ACCELERATED CELL DEATH 6-like [Chenopodium quinoa]
MLAEYLIEIDANLAGELNHSKQTPLHLLCQQHHCYYPKQKKVAKLLVAKDVSAVYSQDVEGFTPLLRAAQTFTYIAASEILKRHPQLIRQNGPQGRNFFHHLTDMNEHSKNKLCEMVPQKEREILITLKDDQGNTPLDLAVEEDDFLKAQFLIECSGDLQGYQLTGWLRQHKITTVRKICHDPIPKEFQKFLQSRDIVKNTISMGLYRSAYDVSKEDIKEFMNTMGVVEALLATITFTAAFTVPGGYKGDTGIPNLGKKAAFQVFMVSDVVGMCSSMMVLFCLLWLLSKDVERDEVQFELVDMIIKLLLLSFYATLVAFMTGVYVTTISDTLWLAIFTCVLCSLLILLMRRRHIKIISFILRELPRHPSLCFHLPDIIKWFR